MAKENTGGFDHSAWEEEAKKERAEYEKSERRKNEMYEEMASFARDVGCKNYVENPGTRSLEFKTWQEALDFQEICREVKNISVRIIEPPKRDYGVFKTGFRVLVDNKEQK